MLSLTNEGPIVHYEPTYISFATLGAVKARVEAGMKHWKGSGSSVSDVNGRDVRG